MLQASGVATLSSPKPISLRAKVGQSYSGASWSLIVTNKPELHLRGERSEMHHGAIALNTHGPQRRPNTLTGEYWTDRATSGQMEFSARIPEIFTRFSDAERAFTS